MVDIPIPPRSRVLQHDVAPLQFDYTRHAAICGATTEGRITPNVFQRFLLSSALSKATDVTLQSDAQPRIEINGLLFKLAGRQWSSTEIEGVLSETYGAESGVAEIRSRKALDFSYEIPCDSTRRRRFRVNATGIHGQGGFGIELTFRLLPDSPPSSVEVGLSPKEIELMTPQSGLVVFAGSTGSGKSSTMAAVARHHLQNKDRQVKIVDIQAPIEFTFENITTETDQSASLIGQSEIGRHLPDFASGVRSALRRNPHIIMVGEARDRETIAATLEAALTGHLVYTTAHAGSVNDCIRRVLASFPAKERDHRASDLSACLQFVMVQRLLPRSGTIGRVAVREWISFSRGAGAKLLTTPPKQWSRFILNCMRSTGDDQKFKVHRKTFAESAIELFHRGAISNATFNEFVD